MDANGGGGNAQDRLAGAVNVGNSSGSGDLDIGQPFIEGSHGIPEMGLGAAYAAVANTDRPGVYIIKADRRTVGKSPWALTANLVEAVAVSVSKITELFGKAALIKVGPTFAMVMNPAAISKKRPAKVVGYWQAVEGQVVEDGAKE